MPLSPHLDDRHGGAVVATGVRRARVWPFGVRKGTGTGEKEGLSEKGTEEV